MNSVLTYSPKKVIFVIGGYQVTGWESITIGRSTNAFIPIRGIRGKNTRVRNTDSSATITIPLLQTSLSNDVLSDIHTQDIALGTGRIELTLKDTGGNSIFSSNEAYILGFPAISYSGGIEYREWKIYCQSTSNYEIGGNPESNVGDILSSGFNAAKNAVSGFLG